MGFEDVFLLTDFELSVGSLGGCLFMVAGTSIISSSYSSEWDDITSSWGILYLLAGLIYSDYFLVGLIGCSSMAD